MQWLGCVLRLGDGQGWAPYRCRQSIAYVSTFCCPPDVDALLITVAMLLESDYHPIDLYEYASFSNARNSASSGRLTTHRIG